MSSARGVELAFVDAEGARSEHALSQLIKDHGSETIEGVDPHYDKKKRWEAIALGPLLTRAFGEHARDLHYVLRASDGYAINAPGSTLMSEGGYIAYRDLDAPGWEPIGERAANPGPLYMVWTGADQNDLDLWPRPYQLASIEVAELRDLYPRHVPTGAAKGSDVRKGFALFELRCVACHALNRQGGQVGPELNVPQNITEYRPIEQIRAYIRNPETFRYSKMPAFEAILEDVEIDQLISYLAYMKSIKQSEPVTAP